MRSQDIPCRTNEEVIQQNISDLSGRSWKITLQPNTALIDSVGTVLFFHLDFDDGRHFYKLLPYNTNGENVALDIAEFLIRMGVRKQAGRLFRKADGRAVDAAVFFMFKAGVATTIRSFLAEHFLPGHSGYFDIMTNGIAFRGPIEAPNFFDIMRKVEGIRRKWS